MVANGAGDTKKYVNPIHVQQSRMKLRESYEQQFAQAAGVKLVPMKVGWCLMLLCTPRHQTRPDVRASSNLHVLQTPVGITTSCLWTISILYMFANLGCY